MDLYYKVATRLFQFILQFKLFKIKYTLKVFSSLVLATFQMLDHMWQMATTFASTDIEHFHHQRNFYWTRLF